MKTNKLSFLFKTSLSLIIFLQTILVFAKKNYDADMSLCLDTEIILDALELPVSQVPDFEYVDLGLPSGTKWGKYNLGAYSDERKGNFYAWGELNSKENFTSQNYEYFVPRHQEVDANGFGRLVPAGYVDIGDCISGTKYDVVTKELGEGWCIPTKEDWFELFKYCKVQKTKKNRAPGLRFIGPNGNWIFLSVCWRNSTNRNQWIGSYWSGTKYNSGSSHAWHFYFNVSDLIQQPTPPTDAGNYKLESTYISNGFAIRPVKK